MTGETLESVVPRLNLIVIDLLPGKLVSFASSFTLEAISLGV